MSEKASDFTDLNGFATISKMLRLEKGGNTQIQGGKICLEDVLHSITGLVGGGWFLSLSPNYLIIRAAHPLFIGVCQ